MKTRSPDLVLHLREWFGNNVLKRLGVAVSGGSDSMALLHGMFQAFADHPTQLFVATIDHGLRPEAAGEAEFVAKAASQLGLSHTTLRWTSGPRPTGNLQAQAREARYKLLTQWARSRDLSSITLGHTADDQAETVLMRLGRAAGVDGLSAMPDRQVRDGINYLRPVLSQRREFLRDFLRHIGQPWIDDPSNQDRRFDRVKLRAAMADLTELGLDVSSLCAVADNMQKAKVALQQQTRDAAQVVVESRLGALELRRDLFTQLPSEIQHRLLVAALLWVGGGQYPPRRVPMEAALSAIAKQERIVLAGCLLLPKKNTIWILREYERIRTLSASTPGLWDSRWQISGPFQTGYSLRAVGDDGLSKIPEWRENNLPREVLMVCPAVWNGHDLVVAPVANLARENWKLLPPAKEDFLLTLLSH